MTENVREKAKFAAREPRSSLVLVPLNDSAVALESIRRTSILSALRDGAVAVDRAMPDIKNDLRDAAVLESSALPRVKAKRDTREKLICSSRASTSVTSIEDVRETIAAGDLAAHTPPISNILERALLRDYHVATTRRRAESREVAHIKGRAVVRAGAVLRSTAIVLGRASPTTRHSMIVRDAARLSDAAHGQTLNRPTLRESLRARGAAMPTATRRMAIRESAFIGDRLDERSDIAWTANTLTWAMSRYEGFGFESVATGFAAAADGVYVPTSDLAPWLLKTGKLDFGDTARKRMTDFYTIGENETPLNVTISADVGGQWQRFSYQQTSQLADSDRAVRNKVGRGFSSTFFQVEINGDEPATIHRAEALIQKTQRKI